MLIDDSRFFWKAMTSKVQPFIDFYYSVKPVIFLPFNIWLYCVTLPFRLFMSVTSGSFWKSTQEMKEKTIELKDKAVEIKDDIKEEILIASSLKSEPAILKRPIRSMPLEDRQPGWYAVDKHEIHDKHEVHDKHDDQTLTRRKSISKKEAPVAESSESPIDEASMLKERIAEFEHRERTTVEDKERLEAQLAYLSSKVNKDEAELASSEKEKHRYRTLINMEQKKCFDFQQQIIALKSQLSREHESLEKANIKISSMTKAKKASKKALKKALKDDIAGVIAEPVAPVAAPEVTHSEEHSAWNTHKVDYTTMVAEAQREELEHGKKFSEVVKDSLMKEEPVMEKSAPEFIVIGGPQSSMHVVDEIRAPVSAN